jgi:prepilin-type N-terminal cleavage/methylation domain-containing protein
MYMTSTKSTQGFTLIELLVVIAIIGILASVILASLNTARDKGSDAAVKADLKGVQNEAAIYYDDNGSTYTDMCINDTNITQALSGAMVAVSAVQNVGGLGDGECVSSATEWAAWVNLKSASTTAWCLDSTGATREVAVQDSSAVDHLVCP